MKKTLSILLLVCMILGMVSMTAFAAEAIPGDVNGDGKVTPYDALQVQAYLHGELTLSDAQIETAIAACPSIDKLSTAHIVSIFFKPLVGQSELATEADGLFHIRTADDMALLRSFPYAGFSLDTDLDMAGQTWTPFAFGGVLLGNGHAIENLSVTAPNSTVNAGALFTKLGAANNKNASVSNLVLANTKLKASATHKFAGLVCGTNYGVLTNVSTYNGQITGVLDSKEKYAGANAGLNYGKVTNAGRTEIDIDLDAATKYIVGGNAAGASAVDSQSHAYKKQGVLLEDIEVRAAEPMNRQAIVDKMYAMSQVKWKVTDPSYLKESDCTFDIRTGRTYTGLPYSHMQGSLENFEASTVSISNGVHTISSEHAYYIAETKTATAVNTPTDDVFLGQIMGADCSSAVAIAWRSASPNSDFTSTSSLAPTTANCNNYCIAKLGNYSLEKTGTGLNAISTCWDANFATNKNLPVAERNYLYCSVVSNEDGTINEEKLKNLFEGYAMCQPGDAIVFSCDGFINGDGSMRTAGHARLVAENAHVEYDALGNIDPDRSYLVTIEQGKKNINTKQNSIYTSWGVFVHYTFRELCGILGADPTKGNYSCYVPVTCPDFQKPDRIPTQIKLVNSSSPFSGIVSSNYGIVCTEVVVDGVRDIQFTGQHPRGTTSALYEGRDESGTAPKLTGTSNRYVYKSVNLARHAEKFTLTSGTHTYTVTVTLNTGETKTWSGTFTS